MLTEEDIIKIELNEMKMKVKHFKKRYDDLQNDYHDLIRRYEELYKQVNGEKIHQEYTRKIKQEDIEILLLDEEKENDKTL